MTWADLVGYVGVALIIGSYYLMQSERWSSKSARYALANASGSGLIIVSLTYNFNWPAFVIECFWFVISIYGWWRHRGSSPNKAKLN